MTLWKDLLIEGALTDPYLAGETATKVCAFTWKMPCLLLKQRRLNSSCETHPMILLTLAVNQVSGEFAEALLNAGKLQQQAVVPFHCVCGRYHILNVIGKQAHLLVAATSRLVR